MAEKSKGADAKRGIPTVSRVAGDTLVELVYDRSACTTALVVSRFGGLWNIEKEVRIGAAEILVPYSPSNNLIANLCVLLPSRPVEFGQKEELVADIRAFLHRYVDLSPVFEQIAAHYILLTWVHDRFNELPYLRLRGEYGTGKTRGLMAIGSLCYKPFFASGASTTSPIFHTLDAFGGTLLLDEADFRFSDATADLVKILNNGTVRGMPVLRTIQNRHREFNPAAFKVFGPKILAMRGSFFDEALESRFLTEETGRRPLRKDVPIHLPDSFHAEALELRNRLLHFRLCEYFNVGIDTSALMPNVQPRLNQTAVPLLSIVDDAELRREIQTALVEQHENILSERRDTTEARVAATAWAAIRASADTPVTLREITDRFNAAHSEELGCSITNRWIGHILRARLGLTLRKSNGVYIVPADERSKLESLVAKYGISIEDTSDE